MSKINLSEMQQRLAFVMQETAKQNVSAAEASISLEQGLSINVRNGEIETLEHHNDRAIGITVYQDHRKGSVSTSDLSDDGLCESIRHACSIAGYTARDEFSGLADSELMAKTISDLDLYHPWQLTVDEYIELAKQSEAAALTFDPRISNSEGASLNTHIGAVAYANSHGFNGAYLLSRHSLSCSVIAQADDHMQRDYWYDSARDYNDLPQAEIIGQRAAEKAIQRLNSRKIPTGQVPVIFVPEMARSLLGHFIGAIRGAAIYRKASFLLDKLGDKIFPEFITIKEQPHLLKGIGSAPFDNEGVATQARDWVSKGVLNHYILDSYSARKLGMENTGNAGGVRNITLSQNRNTGLDAMIAEMGRGLIVTELMGQGVNTVTGDYSRGASGFWVENGEIQYPVEEITVAGNLHAIYLGIVAVGNDVDKRGNIQTGSILVNEMMVAGN